VANDLLGDVALLGAVLHRRASSLPQFGEELPELEVLAFE
jgi:hypothetical protein